MNGVTIAPNFFILLLMKDIYIFGYDLECIQLYQCLVGMLPLCVWVPIIIQMMIDPGSGEKFLDSEHGQLDICFTI